jgi:hypothetical protein
MSKVHRRRRSMFLAVIGAVLAAVMLYQTTRLPDAPPDSPAVLSSESQATNQPLARDELAKLPVKGRAPKTGYARDEFGAGWAAWAECDTRQRILARDMTDVKLADDDCTVLSGRLADPYTGQDIEFSRSAASAVQIDHVVALSNAWQTGAQQFDKATRTALANDDLELLAVEGAANQQKGDGDAATWLPKNKTFRCQYVARQIAVKRKYNLWVTTDERATMAGILDRCEDQRLPTP